MIHQMLSVFDVKAGCYARPVAMLSDAVGVRAFQDAVNDKSTEYAKHPEDYSIFNVGTFDDSTGEFTSSKPTQLAQACVLLSAVVE